MKKRENIFLTPIKSIRAECKYCMVGSSKEIRDCKIIKCPSWGYRRGRRPTVKMLESLSNFFNEKNRKKFLKTPIGAIRSYCSDCSDGPKDIRNCSIKTCALWAYRLGKRPTDKIINELRKSLITENLIETKI